MSKARVAYLCVLVALSCVCEEMSTNMTTDRPTGISTNDSATTPLVTVPPTTTQKDNASLTNVTDGDKGKNSTPDNSQDYSSTAAADRQSTSGEGKPTTSHPQTPTTQVRTTGTPTTSTTSTTKAPGSDSGPVGVIFLILILILVVALAVILYILWKKGRSYSFDLTYTTNDDTPLRSMEHGGFEQTSKELATEDHSQDEKPHETNPTANGCAGETPRQASPSEQQDVPEEDNFLSDASLTPPLKKVEFNLDLDLIGGEISLEDQASPEASDPQQNENNNNFTSAGNSSLDFFTEINLDEPQ